MRKICASLFLTLVASHTYAGTCGAGKIEKLFMGGWNNNDLVLKIDYSVQSTSHSGTEFSSEYIRFQKAELDETRFNMIFSMAISAYHADSVIYTSSHNSSCTNATELSFRR